MFMVARHLFRSFLAFWLEFLMWKLDEVLEMLLLLLMWRSEMLLYPDCLLQFRKDAMLRLFREYLEPILRDKLGLVCRQLGR